MAKNDTQTKEEMATAESEALEEMTVSEALTKAIESLTPEEIKEWTAFGAGAVITSNEVLLVKAFKDQSRAGLLAQMKFWIALDKVVKAYKKAALTGWDGAYSGYQTDTKFVDGIPRLVKKSEGKTRGRKPTVKPNPANDC